MRNAAAPSNATTAARCRLSPPSPSQRVRSSSDQYELGAEQQPGGHCRHGNVERRVGYRELGGIQPSCECGGRGNQRCPAKHDSRDERDERDGADPDADLWNGSLPRDIGTRHDGEKTRRAADARRYARASRV